MNVVLTVESEAVARDAAQLDARSAVTDSDVRVIVAAGEPATPRGWLELPPRVVGYLVALDDSGVLKQAGLEIRWAGAVPPREPLDRTLLKAVKLAVQLAGRLVR